MVSSFWQTTLEAAIVIFFGNYRQLVLKAAEAGYSGRPQQQKKINDNKITKDAKRKISI